MHTHIHTLTDVNGHVYERKLVFSNCQERSMPPQLMEIECLGPGLVKSA